LRGIFSASCSGEIFGSFRSVLTIDAGAKSVKIEAWQEGDVDSGASCTSSDEKREEKQLQPPTKKLIVSDWVGLLRAQEYGVPNPESGSFDCGLKPSHRPALRVCVTMDLPVLALPSRTPCGALQPFREHPLRPSEKGEALLRGVLTLLFVSHAQPARLWKAGFFQIVCSWFGNPPQKWLLGAGFLGAPPLSLIPCDRTAGKRV